MIRCTDTDIIDYIIGGPVWRPGGQEWQASVDLTVPKTATVALAIPSRVCRRAGTPSRGTGTRSED